MKAPVSSPTTSRVSKTRDAFASGDGNSSKQAHDETLKDWEEDGHNAGERAEETYRRVDAVQSGLVCAVVVEALLGGEVARALLVKVGLTVAVALGLREGCSKVWYARHYEREYKRETWELENYEQGEQEEMVGLWSFKGLRRTDATEVISTMSKYKEFFVGLMMTEELHMFAPVSDPVHQTLTFIACVSCGAVGPLALGGVAEAAAPSVMSSDYGAALLSRTHLPMLVTFASATAGLAATGGWRASTSGLPEQKHSLESAALGLACLILPKLLL